MSDITFFDAKNPELPSPPEPAGPSVLKTNPTSTLADLRGFVPYSCGLLRHGELVIVEEWPLESGRRSVIHTSSGFLLLFRENFECDGKLEVGNVLFGRDSVVDPTQAAERFAIALEWCSAGRRIRRKVLLDLLGGAGTQRGRFNQPDHVH